MRNETREDDGPAEDLAPDEHGNPYYRVPVGEISRLTPARLQRIISKLINAADLEVCRTHRVEIRILFVKKEPE